MSACTLRGLGQCRFTHPILDVSFFCRFPASRSFSSDHSPPCPLISSEPTPVFSTFTLLIFCLHVHARSRGVCSLCLLCHVCACAFAIFLCVCFQSPSFSLIRFVSGVLHSFACFPLRFFASSLKRFRNGIFLYLPHRSSIFFAHFARVCRHLCLNCPDGFSNLQQQLNTRVVLSIIGVPNFPRVFALNDFSHFVAWVFLSHFSHHHT
jgi:hypothetical protein